MVEETAAPPDQFGTAQLSEVRGDVSIYTETLGSQIKVEREVGLVVGTEILTNENSSAKLELSDGSTVRLGSQTKVIIDKMSMLDGAPVVQLKLEFGKMWAVVPYEGIPGQSRFTVVMPVGVATIPSGPTYMSSEWNSASELAIVTCLFGDNCLYQNENGGVTLTGQQQTESENGGAPSAPRPIEGVEQVAWANNVVEVITLTPPATATLPATATQEATATEEATATLDATETELAPTPDETDIANGTPGVTITAVVQETPTQAEPTPNATDVANGTPGVTLTATSEATATETPDPNATATETPDPNATATEETATAEATATAIVAETLTPTVAPGAADTAPVWAPESNRIAFVAERDGNKEIYVMASDGTGQANISNNSALDDNPSWNPISGSNLIVFETNRDGNLELYTMKSDGSEVTNITNSTGDDSNAIWAPGGDRLAFVSTRDGNSEIYVMNADGTDVNRITNNNATDSSPTWSTEGNKIAYISDRDGNQDIWVADLSALPTVNEFQVTNITGANNFSPVWSPVPSSPTIAYLSNRDGNNEVYIVDFTTLVETRITTSTDVDENDLTWRADGLKMAFVGVKASIADIYTINISGTGYANITQSNFNDTSPSWAFDNSGIIFVSNRDGNAEIYLTTPVGDATTRLTTK